MQKNVGLNSDLVLMCCFLLDHRDAESEIFRTAVLAKFSQHEELRRRLLHDVPCEAVFVEHCADAEWGDGGDGSGKNLFGKVLTEVRDTLAQQVWQQSSSSFPADDGLQCQAREASQRE